MIREATREGRSFARVRAVNLPLSDYNRWSHVVARHNNEAGEDIRYITRDLAKATGLPDHDYWLFDSRKLAIMRFDRDNRFLGSEIVEDPSLIVQHDYWRDAAWHHAVRRDEFVTEERLGRI